MNLLLLESDEIGPTGDVQLCGPRARHLFNVLRVVPGQQVRVGLVDGPRGVGVVTSVVEGTSGAAGGTIGLHCTFELAVPPRPRVDLLLALPRPKVLQRLWAQLAALGVGQIILTNAERVERNYFDAHVVEPRGYRPLLIEGLQQARDTRVPRVSAHRQFKVLVEDQLDGLCPSGRRLIADPAATDAVSTALSGAASDRVLLAIGPEGGWNDFERMLLVSHGFVGVGMGPRTLRSDTACLALLALVHDALAAQA